MEPIILLLTMTVGISVAVPFFIRSQLESTLTGKCVTQLGPGAVLVKDGPSLKAVREGMSPIARALLSLDRKLPPDLERICADPNSRQVNDDQYWRGAGAAGVAACLNELGYNKRGIKLLSANPRGICIPARPDSMTEDRYYAVIRCLLLSLEASHRADLIEAFRNDLYSVRRKHAEEKEYTAWIDAVLEAIRIVFPDGISYPPGRISDPEAVPTVPEPPVVADVGNPLTTTIPMDRLINRNLLGLRR